MALAAASERRSGSKAVAAVALARTLADPAVRAVEAQAGLLGVGLLPPVVIDAPDPERELRRLVEASFLAVRERFDVLMYPAHGGPDHSRVVRIVDAGVHVGRLASLGERSLRVDTPYADLSDRQLADLAVDMDLPVWLCDWAIEPSPDRDRWVAVLKEAGWVGDPTRADLSVHISPGRASPIPNP